MSGHIKVTLHNVFVSLDGVMVVLILAEREFARGNKGGRKTEGNGGSPLY